MRKPKQRTIETKRSRRTLACPLTKEELITAARAAADATTNYIQTEARRKEIMDQFKARLSGLDAEMQQLAAMIRAGYQIKEIDCEEQLDVPEPGSKRIIRLDTMEEVAVEQMTPAELQRELPMPTGPQEGDES